MKLDTDEGISGFGEVSPLGTHYGRGWGGAAVSGVPLLAQMIIGEDPLQIEKLNRMWDVKFKEDQYVKAPIDAALWNIAGKDGLLGFNGAPGLGVSPRMDVLGEPVRVVE